MGDMWEGGLRGASQGSVTCVGQHGGKRGDNQPQGTERGWLWR